MKALELPGQWVWVEVGMPVLFRSNKDGPVEVQHDRVVKVERIEAAAGATPALAIWSDAEGTYGVDVDRVRNKVMSLPPSGNSPVRAAAELITGRMQRGRRG